MYSSFGNVADRGLNNQPPRINPECPEATSQCSTSPKYPNGEVPALRELVGVLKAQVEARNEQILGLHLLLQEVQAMQPCTNKYLPLVVALLTAFEVRADSE